MRKARFKGVAKRGPSSRLRPFDRNMFLQGSRFEERNKANDPMKGLFACGELVGSGFFGGLYRKGAYCFLGRCILNGEAMLLTVRGSWA